MSDFLTAIAGTLSEWALNAGVLAAALLLYVYLGYPILLAVLAVICRRERTEVGYTPFVSVVISAYNEEASIDAKIGQMLNVNYPADQFEIVIVSDGSTDRTHDIVRACPDPRVRLLAIDGRKGKTNAQNEAVRQCRGDVVVFSDATAVYHAEALRYLACHYDDPGVGAVSGRYKYFEGKDASSSSGLGSIAFWNYENWIKESQSRIGTLTGCSGCIYSVRRSAYVPLPADACSDLVEPLHVIKNGYRVVFECRALAYEQTTASATEEFRMRVRVVTRGIHGVLSVPALLNPLRFPGTAFQLFSHKIMRWLAPVFLMVLWLASATAAGQPVWRWLFLLQTAFYAIALISLAVPLHRVSKALGLPLYFCTLNAAAAMSLIKVLRGQKFTTWDTIRNTSGCQALSAAAGSGRNP